MRRAVLAASIILAAPLAAQDHPLGVFSSLTGEWEGEAWYQRGEARQAARQREWIAVEAGGTVITVRGQGSIVINGQERVIHQAFAVIHQNHEKTGLMMRAFTAEGHWLDPEIVRTEKGYTWRMRDARIGDIKYEMTIDEQGRWVENGFFSRDNGATWTPFMGMVLTRKPS